MSEPARDRILDAAAAAFIELGPSGARIEAIAERADVSKQLIYHYFKSKRGLLEAVMLRHLATHAPLVTEDAVDLRATVTRALEDLHADRPWLRLLAWEALQPDEGPIVAESERREHLQAACTHVAVAQAGGALPKDVPPELAALALFGMCIAPFLAPQLAHLVARGDVSDPAFRARYADAIVALTVRSPPAP